MTINDIIATYKVELDKFNIDYINTQVAEKGIEEYLNQQLVYLDCSRIINDMRMMQTIGYPYKKEMSSYIYALNEYVDDIDEHKDFTNKLIERHIANIEYEKENPPTWYGGKPKKTNKGKQKAKEGDMFPKETKKAKISKAESKLAAKLLGADLGFSFKFKK